MMLNDTAMKPTKKAMPFNVSPLENWPSPTPIKERSAERYARRTATTYVSGWYIDGASSSFWSVNFLWHERQKYFPYATIAPQNGQWRPICSFLLPITEI